jgi:hypothetical protein
MSAEDRLEDLAGSVLDGKVVDWNTAEREGRAAGGDSSVRAMRDLARIVDFSKELQRSPSRAEDASPATAGFVAETKRWGHLTLLELAGTGAMGEVWRAWDSTLQREVALKFPQARGAASNQTLVEEARALARLRHPGVVSVHGIAEHDERVGIWMEFLRGPTLHDEIERRGALPAREVARIGIELCSALEAVDRAGLVHRDIKPGNVILESDGRVVLTDFGLGWRRNLEGAGDARPSGTPLFMSPGLFAGEPASSHSDLYALGVTLRWALAGHSPFKSRLVEDLRTEVSRGPATALSAEQPSAPEAIVSAIEGAMSQDSGARIRSASEMAALLKRGLLEADRNGSRSRAARTIAIVALLAGALAAAIWIAPRLRSGGRAPARTSEISGGAPGTAPAGGGATQATGPFMVDATFISRTGGAYRSLRSGDRVSPGDRLSLEFHGTRPLWVYVLNEDERGETYLLFPQPLFDTANPIAPESTVVLPGTIGGRENAWTVTSRGGREHFLVVASAEPVREIESELKKLPGVRPDRPVRYAPVDPRTVERLRGVGGVAPLPPESSSRRADAFERFRGLAGRETVTHGIWARTITLDNPAR